MSNIGNTLKRYITKVSAENSVDAFASVTDRAQQPFPVGGTVIVPLSSDGLPETFNEQFQLNVRALGVDIPIELVGSCKVGFLSVKNNFRVLVSKEMAQIQVNAEAQIPSVDIAKIVFALVKAADRTPKNNVLLQGFSSNFLFVSIQDLLRPAGFLVEEKDQDSQPDFFKS